MSDPALVVWTRSARSDPVLYENSNFKETQHLSPYAKGSMIDWLFDRPLNGAPYQPHSDIIQKNETSSSATGRVPCPLVIVSAPKRQILCRNTFAADRYQIGRPGRVKCAKRRQAPTKSQRVSKINALCLQPCSTWTLSIGHWSLQVSSY